MALHQLYLQNPKSFAEGNQQSSCQRKSKCYGPIIITQAKCWLRNSRNLARLSKVPTHPQQCCKLLLWDFTSEFHLRSTVCVRNTWDWYSALMCNDRPHAHRGQYLVWESAKSAKCVCVLFIYFWLFCSTALLLASFKKEKKKRMKLCPCSPAGVALSSDPSLVN